MMMMFCWFLVIFFSIRLSGQILGDIPPHPTFHSKTNSIIPQAIVHIGPPKTGTTSFQTFLHHSTLALQNYSYYTLGNCPKSQRIIINKLFNSNENDVDPQSSSSHQLSYSKNCTITTEEFYSFLTTHLVLHQNVIISAEDLSFLSKNMLHQLQTLLAGYEIKIILTYRCWITLIYSLFNQYAKSFHSKPFFEYYLHDNFHSSSSGSPGASNNNNHNNNIHQSSFFHQLISNYKSIFQPSSVYIIDYYGMLAEKKEITSVICCDILLLCSSSPEYFHFPSLPTQISHTSSSLSVGMKSTPSSNSTLNTYHQSLYHFLNPSIVLSYLQYLDIFNQYLRFYHSCRLKYQYFYYINTTHADITKHLWSNISIDQLPIIKKSNPHLIQQSLDQDTLIRNQHQDVHWLYSNPIENQRIAQEFSFEEINALEILGSSSYSDRFLQIKEYFEQKNLIICHQKRRRRGTPGPR